MINKNFYDWQAIYYDWIHITMWQSTFLWCISMSQIYSSATFLKVSSFSSQK